MWTVTQALQSESVLPSAAHMQQQEQQQTHAPPAPPAGSCASLLHPGPYAHINALLKQLHSERVARHPDWTQQECIADPACQAAPG